MSELWKDLIAREDGALAARLRLSRVSISRKTGQMRVKFASETLLNDRDFSRVERLMASAFPAVRVKVQMEYPSMREAVLQDVTVASPIMKSLVKHESPGCMHFIDWNGKGWSLKDGMLTVCVSSEEGAAFLKSRRVDAILAEKLKDLFGIKASARIVVTGDEEKRIARIAEERQRQEALLAQTVSADAPESRRRTVQSDAIVGKNINELPLPMNQVTEDVGKLTVCGEVQAFDIKDTKTGSTKIVTFSVTDYLGSVNCKLFLGGKNSRETPGGLQALAESMTAALKPGSWVKARGSYRYDDFSHEMVLMVNDLMAAEKPVREDRSTEKRVELHCHTTYSTMDACASASDLIKQAAKWGHKAIAITDHGVVQAFPEAFGAAKKNNIKLIPGCEGYLIDDDAGIVENGRGQRLDDCAYVVLDVETTGLNTHADEIIEIGAVRIENGVEVAEFSELIDPGREVPAKVVELTGITTAMLRGKRTIMQAMPDFAKFCEGAVLVAHNASFDMSFFRRAFRQASYPFDFTIVDTLALVRNQFPHNKTHKLGNRCKQLGISLLNAHRAVHDARATSLLLIKVLDMVRAEKGVEILDDLNTCFPTDPGKTCYHIILLASTQEGMAHLYRLISEGASELLPQNAEDSPEPHHQIPGGADRGQCLRGGGGVPGGAVRAGRAGTGENRVFLRLSGDPAHRQQRIFEARGHRSGR